MRRARNSVMTAMAMSLVMSFSVGVSAKTTVTIWTCFGFQPHKSILDGIFKDFEKANPDIRVKHVVPTSDSGLLPEKLLTVMAGGSGPSIAWVAPERVSWLYDAGAVIPISQLEKLGGKLDSSDFYRGMWRANFRKSQKWGVPFENSNLALYYNKSLFGNAGIGSPPTTWDELTSDALKVFSKDKRIGGIATLYADWYFPMWLAQKGAAFTNPEGTKITWNSDAAVQAVQWYTDLQVKHKVTGGDFFSGKSAMYIDGNWAYPNAAKTKLNFGIVPLPVAQGGEPATFAAYKELLIFKGDNKEMAAAWKLNRFIMEPAVFSRWCIATGYLPMTKSQARYPDMKAYLDKNPELVKGHLAQSDDAYFPPILRNTKTIWATFQTGIDQILSGKKSVRQAMDETAAKAQVQLKAK